MSDQTLDRRTILQAGLVTAASATVLAGCGDGGTRGGANNAAVTMPRYTAYANRATPDLPGNADGVLDGYLKYPANPPAVTGGPLGDGGAVSAFVLTFSPIVPGVDRNKYWQRLNEALNVSLRMSVVPANDYGSKFNTQVAGNDLPDFVMIRGVQPDLPQLLAAKFQNLTDFLSGDAVKEYPFLANIPEVFWSTSTRYNGGIYGLPVPRSTMGGLLYRRDDIIAAKGLDPNPTSFAEFRKLCEDLTDARRNVWALTSAAAVVGFVEQMLGLPNNGGNLGANGWKNDAGKLTNIIELEQTKQALSVTADLVRSGFVHPDSFAGPNVDLTTNYKQWFNAGNAVLTGDNYTAWPQYYVQNVAGPSFRIGGIMPPNFDSGSTAVTWQGTPTFNFTALKKASPDRIRALLRIANWLATPFGTAEYLLRYYGVEGTDWTLKDGDPAPTQTGNAEVPGLGVRYIVDSPQVLYYAGQPQATKDAHAFMTKFLPKSIANPVTGLDSDTNSRRSNVLNQKITDAANSILRGQQPVSSWDDAVKSWRTNGGDQIRGEFEQALQQQGGGS